MPLSSTPQLASLLKIEATLFRALVGEAVSSVELGCRKLAEGLHFSRSCGESLIDSLFSILIGNLEEGRWFSALRLVQGMLEVDQTFLRHLAEVE